MNEVMADGRARGAGFLEKFGGKLRVELLTKQQRERRRLARRMRRKDFEVLSEEMLESIPVDGSGAGAGAGANNSSAGADGAVSNGAVQTSAGANISGTTEGAGESVDHFSLYQGFEATMPDVDARLQQFRSGARRLEDPSAGGARIENSAGAGAGQSWGSLDTWGPVNSVVPGTVGAPMTEEAIAQETDPAQLVHSKDAVNYRLDLVEIRRGLAQNEVSEIDARIARLQRQRDEICGRMDTFDDSRDLLESQLAVIESRLLEVGKRAPGDPVSSAGVDSTDVGSTGAGSAGSASGARADGPPDLRRYQSGEMIRSFHAHEGEIAALAYTGPAGLLVTASTWDSTPRVWGAGAQGLRGQLVGHKGPITCVDMQAEAGGSLVVTGSGDYTVRLWSVGADNSAASTSSAGFTTINSLQKFVGHVDQVSALSFNGSTLVSAASDKTIRQWDVETGRCVQTIDILWATMSREDLVRPAGGAADYEFTAAVQCYDAALASGGADGIVRLWDLRSGDVVRELPGRTEPITCLQFDDRNIVTGCADGCARVWDLRSGQLTQTYRCAGSVRSLQFDYDRVVVADGSPVVKVFNRDVGTQDEVGADDGTEEVGATCARYAEGCLAVGREDGRVEYWAM